MNITHPPYAFPQDFHYAISLERHLDDLPVHSLIVANLGAGSPETAFTPQICALPFNTLFQVEIHQPYLEALSELFYETPFVYFALEDIRRWTPPCPIDVLLCCDVLEHLSKEDGLTTLKRLSRYVTKRILIWMPMGECAQEEYDGNSHQEHKSQWTPEDFACFDNVSIEYYRAFHKHIEPNADAAWIEINV